MVKDIDLRKCLVLFVAMGVIQPLLAAPDDFTITVDTQLGTGATFTIPTYGIGYNYDVDCDTDGTYEATGQTGNYTCDYSGMGGSGIYTIQIKDAVGDGTGFPRVRFNDLGEAGEIIELSKWGSGLWETMDSIFEDADNMTVTTEDNPDLRHVFSMKDMFKRAIIANPDTSGWYTANVENMSGMFFGADLANPDTSNWDTANVKNMSYIFNGADIANPNTSGWNTAKVTNMTNMFANAAAANPTTSGWDTANVTSMNYMFTNTNAANPDTSGWNTTKVTTMTFMFRNAIVANPDTSNWDTSNVEDMSFMFRETDVANPDTSGWDTANVTDMNSMFRSTILANPDTSGWDTSDVMDMNSMFSNANVANPDTSSWDITAVTTMRNMFSGVTLPTSSYDAMLIHFNSQVVQSGVEFSGGDSKYCDTGDSARDNLINSDGWIITDGGLDSLCDDIIFRNSFELPVLVFNAYVAQFTFDFSLLDDIHLDSYPELIAIGLDDDQTEMIKFHVRKSADKLQIRLSDFYPSGAEQGQWINQDWQNISNLELTTITW